MAIRTVRDFQVGFDVAPIVDAWAQSNHYGFRGVGPDGSRAYQRGNGIVTGTMPLTIRQNGPSVHLEAWIHATIAAHPALGVVQQVRLFDVWRDLAGAAVAEKSLAFRFWLQDTEVTLDDARVDACIAEIRSALETKHHARQR